MSKNDEEQEILTKLGRRIRNLRSSINLSQEELAERAGVHRTYVGMIERGERNITVISILKISFALQKNLSEIFEDFEDGQ